VFVHNWLQGPETTLTNTSPYELARNTILPWLASQSSANPKPLLSHAQWGFWMSCQRSILTNLN
jgi:hypothetical protein